ncbi:hypothetical protein HYW42_05595 [Candidatus Daviesbacteria bacterium]|nr:hypothetical protein [Candidatus Daviesbacteria bacterium]
MPERISRRTFIIGSLATAGAAAGYFLGRELTQPPQTTERAPTENWTEVVIPTRDGTVWINGAKDKQNPPIGIDTVYVVTRNSSIRGGFAVVVLFDPNTTKTPPNSRLELKGNLKFQPITDPFEIDEANPNPNDYKPWTRQQELNLTAYALDNIASRVPRERILGNSVVRIFPRPDPFLHLALVFGEGHIEYNGKPSPKSYLSYRFRFEKEPASPA